MLTPERSERKTGRDRERESKKKKLKKRAAVGLFCDCHSWLSAVLHSELLSFGHILSHTTGEEKEKNGRQFVAVLGENLKQGSLGDLLAFTTLTAFFYALHLPFSSFFERI